MKNALLISGIGGLLLAILSPIQAHMGDRVVRIPELTDEDLEWIDLNDGSTVDWQEVIGDPILTAQDFATSEAGAAYDPTDLEYRIWMGWPGKRNRIYAAMEKVDDEYVGYIKDYLPEEDMYYAMQSDSGVQFLVDGDHSGGEFIPNAEGRGPEELMFLYNKEAQYFMAASEPDRNFEGVGIFQGGGFLYRDDWFHIPPLAAMGGGSFGEHPTVVVTEFYVTPFDFLVPDSPELTEISDLKAGQVIGFEMRVFDFDGKSGGVESSFKSLHGFPVRLGPMGDADRFVDAILVDALGRVLEDTAVEDATWARIKASFR